MAHIAVSAVVEKHQFVILMKSKDIKPVEFATLTSPVVEPANSKDDVGYAKQLELSNQDLHAEYDSMCTIINSIYPYPKIIIDIRGKSGMIYKPQTPVKTRTKPPSPSLKIKHPSLFEGSSYPNTPRKTPKHPTTLAGTRLKVHVKDSLKKMDKKTEIERSFAYVLFKSNPFKMSEVLKTIVQKYIGYVDSPMSAALLHKISRKIYGDIESYRVEVRMGLLQNGTGERFESDRNKYTPKRSISEKDLMLASTLCRHGLLDDAKTAGHEKLAKHFETATKISSTGMPLLMEQVYLQVIIPWLKSQSRQVDSGVKSLTTKIPILRTQPGTKNEKILYDPTGREFEKRKNVGSTAKPDTVLITIPRVMIPSLDSNLTATQDRNALDLAVLQTTKIIQSRLENMSYEECRHIAEKLVHDSCSTSNSPLHAEIVKQATELRDLPKNTYVSIPPLCSGDFNVFKSGKMAKPSMPKQKMVDSEKDGADEIAELTEKLMGSLRDDSEKIATENYNYRRLKKIHIDTSHIDGPDTILTIPKLTMKLRNEFRYWRVSKLAKLHRSGSRLNMGKYIKSLSTGDLKMWRKRYRINKLTICILVDLSGSMINDIPFMARMVKTMFVAAKGDNNIDILSAGFAASGGNHILMPYVEKEYQCARFFNCSGSTPTGPAMVAFYERIKKIPGKKIMLVMTDGEPNVERGLVNESIQDAIANTTKKLEKNQIECIGLGIGSAIPSKATMLKMFNKKYVECKNIHSANDQLIHQLRKNVQTLYA